MAGRNTKTGWLGKRCSRVEHSDGSECCDLAEHCCLEALSQSMVVGGGTARSNGTNSGGVVKRIRGAVGQSAVAGRSFVLGQRVTVG